MVVNLNRNPDILELLMFSGKTILVEKPLFDKYYGLKITKNSVYVGYNLRFHPVIKLIKEKYVHRKTTNSRKLSKV